MYGATGGEIYIKGMAGERFCVRNSAAIAVVEGIGDHGCEYMTGGTVVVLGKTGRNFAAGMSGGIAYVLDQDESFESRLNTEMCETHRININSEDEEILLKLIKKHKSETKSELSKKILNNWDHYLKKFKKVLPTAYDSALKTLNKKHTVKVTLDG